MVSEPNFVFGIKQKSLASKEDSHVHITVRSYTCLSIRSRLHSISQPPWLTTVSKSSSPSNSCLSLSNWGTTSLCLMKPTRQTCSTAYRDQNPGTRLPTAAAFTIMPGQRLLELSQAPPQILDSQLGPQSHASPRQPCRPPIYLAWESSGQPLLHTPPSATWVSDFSSTGRWTCTLLPRAKTLLLMSSDVTRWRYHSALAAMQARPRQRHVIRMS